ncbi:hypothetical protein BD779DRAFT_1463519, partial [Infundibulicybe gibba]
CTFRLGRFVFLHIHNCLSVQSTRAVLWFNAWGCLELAKGRDIKATTTPAGLEREEGGLQPGWDHIEFDQLYN